MTDALYKVKASCSPKLPGSAVVNQGGLVRGVVVGDVLSAMGVVSAAM